MASDARRLKALEDENSKLKKLLAEAKRGRKSAPGSTTTTTTARTLASGT